MRKFFIKLEEKIKTKSDLLFYLKEIDLATEAVLSDVNKPFAEKIEGKITSELKEILLQFNEEEKKQDVEQQTFFLELLKKHIFFLPQIRMEVAFRPDKEAVERIGEWLKEELKQKTVIDLRVNCQIVGGAVFEYKGKWTDFSLAKEINKTGIKITENSSYE